MQPKPGRLIVVTGPAGAGKSTVAPLVAAQLPRSAHVKGDHFFGYVVTGYVDPWLLEAHDQNEVVMRAVADASLIYARGGYDTVVETVVGPRFLRLFMDESIPTYYVVLRPDEPTAVARALERKDGLKNLEAVHLIYDRFKLLGEYERHVLDTTSMSAAQTAKALLDGLETETFRLSGPASVRSSGHDSRES